MEGLRWFSRRCWSSDLSKSPPTVARFAKDGNQPGAEARRVPLWAHCCHSVQTCLSRQRVGSTSSPEVGSVSLDEQLWNDDTYFTAKLQARWQDTRVLPPTVVTVSYGPTWLLTPKGRRPNSGLLDDLMIRMPEIEARAGAPRHRMLMGESMGGLNVLIAGLSYPARFTKLAAL